MVKYFVSLSEMLYKKDYYIPTSDLSVWNYNSDYHHFYNKLWIAETQNLPCGPMGIYPQLYDYPVIFKPIINLYGMSRGVRIINNDKEYDLYIRDGFFWEKYLTGIHRCIDLIVKNGKIYFMSCLISHPAENGSFDYHESDPDYRLNENIIKWISEYLNNYKGLVNLETIDDFIIECHLRFNGDSQLYNDEFVDQLIGFMEDKIKKIKYDIKKIYMIPLFVSKDFHNKIKREEIMKLCDEYGANTIRFDDIYSKNQSEYLSRLLMYDIDNLVKGLELRKQLSVNFH